MIKGTIKNIAVVEPTITFTDLISGVRSHTELTIEVDPSQYRNLTKDFYKDGEPVCEVSLFSGDYMPNLDFFVRAIYVNEEKKAVAVKFRDGKVISKTAAEGDTFDVYAGVALCCAAYLAGSTKEFHHVVDKRIKK